MSEQVPRHDVAIYAPAAACLYERRPQVTGGAERQTAMLASGLARAGLGVAHMVLPVEDFLPAVGQGIIAIEARDGDEKICALLAAVTHPESAAALAAERAADGA